MNLISNSVIGFICFSSLSLVVYDSNTCILYEHSVAYHSLVLSTSFCLCSMFYEMHHYGNPYSNNLMLEFSYKTNLCLLSFGT
jgi:hypothetical protein